MGCILSMLVNTGCYHLPVISDEVVSIPEYTPKKSIDIALVLGGGGSKGLAHLGAIEELEKHGLRPDLIVGCSAGAIAGALYADQIHVEDAVRALLPLTRNDLLDFSFINPILGIAKGDSLHQLLRKSLKVQSFEELKIPLIVVATDLISGDAVEICTGDLPSAIRASCAFPGMFKPVKIFGRHCVDGGASMPVPVSVAKKHGAKFIIAIDLSEKLPKDHPKHLFDITKRSLEIAYRKFVEHALESADVAVRMNFDAVGTFSDDYNQWFYEQGKKVVQAHISEILEKYQKAQERSTLE